jgi:hypothetical protein
MLNYNLAADIRAQEDQVKQSEPDLDHQIINEETEIVNSQGYKY